MVRRRAFVLLILVGLAIANAPAQVGAVSRPHPQLPPALQPTIRDATYQSAVLGRAMKYRILLPTGYDRTVRRYPVLYLLHGLAGSYLDWDTRTHLEDYAADLQLIIVMPDAGNSWYANSAANPQDRFEDYIAKEFIPEIDRSYRTIATRHARAMAGLSMGGYGATKFALKHPNLFVFAGSFSGTMAAAHGADYRAYIGEKYSQQMQQVLGPPGEARNANDVYALAEKADPAALPYFWIACGTGDGLLESNRQFVALLHQRKIAYSYKEAPGIHSWEFWEQQLPAMLRELARHMELNPARPALPPLIPAQRAPWRPQP